MSVGIQVPHQPLPIASEDLAKLGVDAQLIPSVVSATLQVEQSPDGISLTEAENLIEILDKAVSSASAHPRLKDKCLGVLRKVSQTHRVLPKSYFPPGVTLPSDSVPHASGGFADVWKGQLDGNDVCIKAFRVQTVAKPDKIKKRFYCEIVGWKHVSHPNVLPFLGVSETLFPFCLISPWLPNGNITEHIRNRSEVNRLQLLAQAARGLEHLHSLSIVHSNITPENILITEEGDARIGDFGITAIISDPDVVERTNLATSSPGVIRYMAPELLNPKQFGLKRSNPSKETDVYSFAMTTYKVLSGEPPYGGEQDGATAFRIVSGIRPPRPDNSTASKWLPDKVWSAIQSCWAQNPQSRLPIHSLYQELAQAGPEQKKDTPNDAAPIRNGGTKVPSIEQSPPEERIPPKPSTGPPSKHPKEGTGSEPRVKDIPPSRNDTATMGINGTVVSPPEPPPPEEKSLAQNPHPPSELPIKRPEPPSERRKGPDRPEQGEKGDTPVGNDTVPMSANGTAISPPEPPPLEEKKQDVRPLAKHPDKPQESRQPQPGEYDQSKSTQLEAKPEVVQQEKRPAAVGTPKPRKKWFCGLF